MIDTKSVRTTLLKFLLPGFFMVVSASGLGIYHAERVTLEANLKTEFSVFMGKARILFGGTQRFPSRRMGMGMGMGKRQRELSPRHLAFLERSEFNSSGRYYYQLENSKGKILMKSPNLGERQLSKAPSSDWHATLHETTLSDGEPLFVRSFRSNTRDNDVHTLIIGVSRHAIEDKMFSFAQRLLFGGMICCIIMSTLVLIAVAIALSPIKNLSDFANQIHSKSLHQRFPSKNIPTEIRPLTNRLNELIHRLELSFSRERQFGNDIAHELRTPLAAIRTTAEVAVKWPDNSPRQDFIDIAATAENMQKTIDSLFMLARFENSAQNFETTYVDITKIIQRQLNLFQPSIIQHNLSIQFPSTSATPLKSNEKFLEIIISNLISNAVSYAPKNSIIYLDYSKDVVFTIINHAPNLTEKTVQHIFERFWRGDKDRTDTTHAGLGLSLALRCATLMNLQLTASLIHSNHIKMQISTNI